MSKMNINLSALIAGRVPNNRFDQRLQRSTGLRINMSANNSASLIACEALRVMQAGMGQAIRHKPFYKSSIGSNADSLAVALENASAATSAIGDTGFAEETANLTRAQILAQAATIVRARPNAFPHAALQLLQ